MTAPRITVVGARLPTVGETVTGAVLARHPGGKGANQALAAQRLGGEVRLVARIGRDAMADEALALLRRQGVDLSGVITDEGAATGVALIAVSPEAENQIVVCPGANERLVPQDIPDLGMDALVMQLEIPTASVMAAATKAGSLVFVNLAPAADVPDALLKRADVLIVNESEAAFYGDRIMRSGGLVAVTLGSRGARMLKDGLVVAEAVAPKVKAIDTTGGCAARRAGARRCTGLCLRSRSTGGDTRRRAIVAADAR